jgi:hypothetical protein
MKTRTLVSIPIFIVVVAAIFIFASCDNGVKPTIIGTWINADYDGMMMDPMGGGYPAKIVIEQEGEEIFGSWYNYTTDTVPLGTSSLNKDDEWYDTEGNYYLQHWSQADGDDPHIIYQLWRVNEDNDELEVMETFEGYANEIDDTAEGYFILYRDE